MSLKNIALAIGLSACLVAILSLLGVFGSERSHALVSFIGTTLTCILYGVASSRSLNTDRPAEGRLMRREKAES